MRNLIRGYILSVPAAVALSIFSVVAFFIVLLIGAMGNIFEVQYFFILKAFLAVLLLTPLFASVLYLITSHKYKKDPNRYKRIHTRKFDIKFNKEEFLAQLKTLNHQDMQIGGDSLSLSLPKNVSGKRGDVQIHSSKRIVLKKQDDITVMEVLPVVEKYHSKYFFDIGLSSYYQADIVIDALGWEDLEIISDSKND